MATALLSPLETLRKQQSPLRVTKNLVTLNSYALRLQKDTDKHNADLAKYKANVESSIAEHQAAILALQTGFDSEVQACASAVQANEAALAKLQGEIQSLSSTRAVGAPQPPSAAHAGNSISSTITPELVRRVLDAVSNAGLLDPAAAQDPQATIISIVATLGPQLIPATPVIEATGSGLSDTERQAQLQLHLQQQAQLQQQQQVLAQQQAAQAAAAAQLMSDAVTGKERPPPTGPVQDTKVAKIAEQPKRAQ